MGQSVAGNLAPDAQMVEFGLDCPQTGLDIPQAFPVGELGEGHAEKLIPAGEALHLVVAVVPLDAFAELVCGDKVHQLGKDRFPGIHVTTPSALMRKNGTSGENISNR